MTIDYIGTNVKRTARQHRLRRMTEEQRHVINNWKRTVNSDITPFQIARDAKRVNVSITPRELAGMSHADLRAISRVLEQAIREQTKPDTPPVNGPEIQYSPSKIRYGSLYVVSPDMTFGPESKAYSFNALELEQARKYFARRGCDVVFE